MDTKRSFGHWLQQRRKALGLRQSELAERVGVAVSTLKKLETEKRRPSRQLIDLLATQLQLTADEYIAFRDAGRAVITSETTALSPIGIPPTEENQPSYQTNLPAAMTSLIGRETLAQVAVEQLQQPSIRLLTFTGPGGVGKTRLALHVANEMLSIFRHGVWFVPLDTIEDVTLFVPTIARTLGVDDAPLPDITDALIQTIRGKQILLILDNLEHMLPAAPQMVKLLAAAPGLKILATSRVVLHLSGEHEISIPPLEVPDVNAELPIEDLLHVPAVQLFCERARAARQSFTLTYTTAGAVGAICQQLNGLPLAIELAAGHIRYFSPQVLSARLTQRFAVLTEGPSDVHPRHQSLRSTFDWSYELLNPDAQQLFAQLGVFVGGWSFDAVVQVAQLSNQRRVKQELLFSLADRSLIQVHEDAEGSPRFTIFETIREYALERLGNGKDLEQTQRRHADYYLQFAEQFDQTYSNFQEQRQLLRLDVELPNLRAAIRWALDHDEYSIAGTLVTALYHFWLLRGYSSEGRRWSAAVLNKRDALPAIVLSRVLSLAGTLAWHQADFTEAQQRFEEALTLRRLQGEPAPIAAALNNLGLVVMAQGEYAQAETLYAESLALRRSEDNPRGIALVLGNLGLAALVQAELDRARMYIEESLAIKRAIDDREGLIGSLTDLAEVLRLQGQVAQALPLLEESLALSDLVGDRVRIIHTLRTLALVAIHDDQFSEAQRHLREALHFCQECGEPVGTIAVIEGFAEFALATGSTLRAVALCAASNSLRSVFRMPASPLTAETTTRLLSTASCILDADTFASAWNEGHGLTIDQAIALALKP
jgi:predicted ATPase/transcriptional regulator with XRE-family HTH domain